MRSKIERKNISRLHLSSLRKIAVSLFLVLSVFSVCKTVPGLSEDSWSKEASHLRSVYQNAKSYFFTFILQNVIVFKSISSIHTRSNNSSRLLSKRMPTIHSVGRRSLHSISRLETLCEQS